MYLLGTFLIVTAVAMAMLAVGSYALVIRGNRSALMYGRFGVYATLGAMVMAWITARPPGRSTRASVEK